MGDNFSNGVSGKKILERQLLDLQERFFETGDLRVG
jgi:hypothetical protein